MVYLKNYSVILLLLTTLPLLATARNDDWRLVWSDEFNTEGRLSPSVWNYEQGYVRNEEAQWYQPDNAVCKGGDRKSTRLNSSHRCTSRMPSSA